jgi:hypothetical protein
VVLFNPGWPRPWPYPDGWLQRWSDRLEAGRPPRPAGMGMTGEIQAYRGRLAAGSACCLALSVGGGIWWIARALRRPTGWAANEVADYAERPSAAELGGAPDTGRDTG